MRTTCTSNDEANTVRTARYAVLASMPGLVLTGFAAASSTSLTIRADLVLTLLDMIALTTAWALAERRRRAGRIPCCHEKAEALAAAFVALCMGLSMAVVASVAIQRILAGGMAAQGSGVILGATLNFGYGTINFWILRRWQARGRVAPSPFIRSQICLFSDKLSSNLLISLSLAAALILEGTAVARFIDPVAGLLIAAATARWMLPVARDTVRALRSAGKSTSRSGA